MESLWQQHRDRKAKRESDSRRGSRTSDERTSASSEPERKTDDAADEDDDDDDAEEEEEATKTPLQWQVRVVHHPLVDVQNHCKWNTCTNVACALNLYLLL